MPCVSRRYYRCWMNRKSLITHAWSSEHNAGTPFWESKQADRQRIRDEMLAGRNPPSGYIGWWGFHVGVNKRFEAFLRAQYADEIAIMMEIAPDYLAITRQAVEATSPPGEIAETGNGG